MSQMRRASSFSTSKVLNYALFSHLSQQGNTQSSQTDDGKKTVMYFVIPPGETEDSCLTRNIGEMYQTAEAHFLSVNWIKDDQCKNQVWDCDGNVFVFEFFDSPGFNHVKSQSSTSSFRVEILGPQVLRYVFSSQEVLSFTTKSSPTYTLAMRNMIISLSGFSGNNKAIREELENMIRYMNGTLCATLTKAVTHVVTASSLTKKSIEAQKQQLPVMSEEWVREVWNDNLNNPVDASERKYVKYSCPIFYNIGISMSQINPAKKAKLKEAVELRGGKCSPDMIKGKTEVLIITKPEGTKYKYARVWKIHCATPDWIERSVEQGRLLPPEDFAVVPEDLDVPRPNQSFVTSTPAHSIAPDHDFNMNGTRFSVISNISRVVVNETNETFQSDSFSGISRLETLNTQLKAITAKGYLDGVRVFVVECEKHDGLKKAINQSGATRRDELTDGITHVIVSGEKLPKPIQEKISALNPAPSVVTIDWVLQSARLGYPADDELFKFGEESFMLPPPEPSALVARVSATFTGVQNQSGAESSISIKPGDVNNSNRDTTTTSDGDSRKDSDTTLDSEKSTSETETTNTSCHETNTEDPDHSPGLFVGISFYVWLEDSEEYRIIEELIVEHGGKLKANHADVAILPPVCKPSELEKAAKAFTKEWLFDCLYQTTLDVLITFHHIPHVSFKKMNEILADVVCAISQYQPAARAYIVELVKAMGGKTQEVFAKNDSKDRTTAKSTHLICTNMDTDKAKAAKRWNVPVVVADWVVDCVTKKKRLPEANYHPSVQPSTSDDHTVFMPTPQRRNATKNHNASVGDVGVYPPSTSKAIPLAKPLTKSSDLAIIKEIPQPGTSKSKRVPSPENDSDRDNAHPVPSEHTTAPKNNAEQEAILAGGDDHQNMDGGAGNHAEGNVGDGERQECPTDEEIARKLAELGADFPYTDESYEEFMNQIKARGINLDDVSPFTSFEERRICNIDSDSPLVAGLPRKESRAMKEQFAYLLARSPGVPTVKMKTPNSTPMRVLVARFNALQNSSSPDERRSLGSPLSSTPKSESRQQLRRVAAVNRISFNASALEGDGFPPVEDVDQLETNEVENLRSTNKRPSDSPPEDISTNKRARTSKEESLTEEHGEGVGTELKELHVHVVEEKAGSSTKGEKPTSKKINRMQALTDLIAENQAKSENNGSSPAKRKSADMPLAIVLPCDDENVHEIERPHLSWVEDRDSDTEQTKKSTVKRNANQRRLKETSESTVEPLRSVENDGRKRSSRLKSKAPTTITEPEARSTGRRTRSQSKTRKEESAPYGHQPIKVGEDRKKSKKKANESFSIHLPNKPVFVLSSLSGDERNEAIEVIEKLGGSVSKLSHYDPNTTVLVANSLVRSEKVLGCIAAGKCMVRYNYLEECAEHEQFLPIGEAFLWHEENVNLEKEKELARAGFNWLKAQMADKAVRPMAGKRFYFLDIVPEKLNAYLRLVAAGGGEVVKSLNEATWVIGDEKTTPVESLPAGVEYATALILNSLILSDPPE